jgi:nitrite reductase/ring-hydroxylating ferredoxin subunit
MSWTRVARVAEIMPWTVIQHTHAGANYAICNVDGDIRALHGTCPHQNGPLYQGMLDEESILCPLHAWKFNTKTGTFDADVNLRIPVYAVRIENGEIFADLPEASNA